MTLTSAPLSMICARPIATNIALILLDHMNVFVVKDMISNMAMLLLIDKTIALISMNVHLVRTIVTLLQLALTKNLCGRANVMMDITVMVITAPKSTTVNRIHVHSIRNASGMGSTGHVFKRFSCALLQ